MQRDTHTDSLSLSLNGIDSLLSMLVTTLTSGFDMALDTAASQGRDVQAKESELKEKKGRERR